MHTYRRADGTFYDASLPEDAADEPLPLRPSDIHQWDGRRWVWRGQRIQHAFPREADVEGVLNRAQAADLASLVAETHEIQEAHSRAIVELRERISAIGKDIGDHLVEAKPLMEAVDGLRSIIKAAGTVAQVFNAITTLLKFVWRFGLTLIGIYGAVWAVMHGDLGALRRAISLMWGHPTIP